MLTTLTAVIFGSAAGGGLRWLVGGWVQGRTASAFPLGTLVVNVTGALVLGFLARFVPSTAASPEWRAMLTAGLCGGYTTFSTFSFETMELLRGGAWPRALIYVGLSVILSLAAMAAGLAGAREVVEWRGRP